MCCNYVLTYVQAFNLGYAILPAVELVDNTKGNEFVHPCLLVSSYVVILCNVPLLIKTVSLLVKCIFSYGVVTCDET